MSTSQASPLEILTSSLLVSQRLQDALAGPWQPIFHRSHWRCLASSYSAVLQALIVLFKRACSCLEPSEQEIMCRRLTPSLSALHQAVQEGYTCMQESLPSSSDATRSWLVEKALELGMSTDVVDLHLHCLLWTSSVVREQILRYSQIDGMEVVISKQTSDLSEIWAHVDAQDDFLSAQIFLNSIMGEEEGEPHQLASFILQKLSFAENLGRITDTADLPLFLWVHPDVLKRNPEIIGEGGYCKVQEAIWLGGRFAVKDFFYIENNVMFGREASIQCQLRHPNVIPLVCCTKNPSLNKCSLVMELMQQDLRVLMMQRMVAGMDPPFPLLLAVDLMLQIAKGMEYLHSNSLRIIHRDLKSSNILVRFSGASSLYANDVSPRVHLKVADFGMSRAKDVSSRYTTTQIGATPWRAPEVFEEGGHPNARYTNKADVYSFGLVCYEILTGKSPFEGLGLTQIRGRVLAGERPRLPAQCPMALSSYIKRCWHAEPAQRPTFTQICRMLRYFKACILIGDHDHDNDSTEYYHNWLLHPLSTTMCARIDDMLQNQVQQCGAILRPQLLVIPLEMYCCRAVLQQFRDETEVNSNQLHGESSLSDVVSLGTVAGSSSTLQDQRSGIGRVASRWTAKGTLKWLKKLSCIKGTQHANSGVELSRKPREAVLLENGGSQELTRKPSEIVLLENGGSQELRSSYTHLTLPSKTQQLHSFSFADLKMATRNFRPASLLGEGDFGTVFTGAIDECTFAPTRRGQGLWVAVKNFKGHKEWQTEELYFLRELDHPNLVKLIGYCCEEDHRLLVYEFLVRGNLENHLFARHHTLSWTTRLKIASDAARGLMFLHDAPIPIIYRDFKTSNILLDSNFNAKLSTIGFAKHGPTEDKAHVTTHGYVAPECFALWRLTTKSDVYGFGVVLLEILTRRRAVDENRVGKEVILVEWAMPFLMDKHNWNRVIYRNPNEQYSLAGAQKAASLALQCLDQDAKLRPTMKEVLETLESILGPKDLSKHY